MAATSEMLEIAKRLKPDYVTLVPEKREEVTTEGGLDVKCNTNYLKNFVRSLKDLNIEVSAFIDPLREQINYSKEIEFEHPVSKEILVLKCDPPGEFIPKI